MSDVAATDTERLERLRAQLAPDLELVRLLGEGSVARVLLAREPALKRMVAVKVLREEIAADDVARARFEREAQAAASISHPNVTAVYRVGHLEDDLPYIVMEYVEGRTLADVLRAKGPLSVEEARRVLASVAHALAAAHRKNVVHRDVRPENVLWESESDRIVLMDFGIAAMLETASQEVRRLTTHRHRVGDPLHMSPEQIRGEPVTQQSDIYGLGILAYEVLSGNPPFEGSSATELAAAHLEREPRMLTALRSDVDEEFAAIVKRGLAKLPDHRPRAREVAEALLREPTRPSASAAMPPRPAVQTAAAPGPLQGFLRELERRKVYRVVVAYIAAAFLFLQGAQLVVPALPVSEPDTWYRAVVAITLAGFPVAVVLSWLFDFSTSGIRRTGVIDTRAPQRSVRRLLLPLLGLALSIAAALGVWLLLMGG